MAKLRIVPLKGHEAFPKVFKKSRKFTEKDAVLYAEFDYPEDNGKNETQPEDSFKTISVGVTIRKKNARSAVMRNRIKRLLRVALRNVLKEWSSTGNQVPFKALIAVWQTVPEHPMHLRLEHVEPVIQRLLVQAASRAAEDFLKKNRVSRQ